MLLRKITQFFFNPGAVPASEWNHSLLGNTIWVEDDEGWRGEFNGIRFQLAYERVSSEPTPEVVAYAQDILAPEFNLAGKIEKACRDAKADFETYYHDEIDGLKVEEVCIYWARDVGGAIVALEGGWDFREWRFELIGPEIGGLGFDS